MPIETICQGCARKLRVPDEHAGKKARCPQCGVIYVVPDSPAASSTPVSPTDSSREHTTEPRSTTKSSNTGSPFGNNPATNRPEATSHTANQQWHLRLPAGRTYGPVTKQELDQWCAEGRIPPNASILHEGDSQWRSATAVYPQLIGRGQQVAPQHNPYVAPQQNPFADIAPTTAVYQSATQHLAPHRGGSILAIAIVGWVVCPILGPVAWAMASGDLQAMKAGRMDPSGRSLTQAGLILGVIQTVFIGIGFLLMCLGGLGSLG